MFNVQTLRIHNFIQTAGQFDSWLRLYWSLLVDHVKTFLYITISENIICGEDNISHDPMLLHHVIKLFFFVIV